MGFWDVMGKVASSIVRQIVRPKCPNCDGLELKYGYSFTKEFGVFNLFNAGFSLASNNVAGLINSSGNFMSGIVKAWGNKDISDLPANPVLFCKDCHIYFIVCPECLSDQALSGYAKIGDVYKCGKCDEYFTTCARSDEFDTYVNND